MIIEAKSERGLLAAIYYFKHQEKKGAVLITTANRGYDTWNRCNMYPPRFCTTHVVHASPRGVLTFPPHVYLQGSLRIHTSADQISSLEGRFLCRIISSRTCDNHFQPAPFSLWGLLGLYYILRWQRGTNNRKHREREWMVDLSSRSSRFWMIFENISTGNDTWCMLTVFE